MAGGLPVLEVTLRTPHALQVIEEMAKVAGAVVGSGTVRSPLQMGHSVDAGCQFMVSPGASPRLLEAAEDHTIPLLPGIGTPTEAMTAAEHGYSFLKFFPAEALGGAPVLKAYASPLPRHHVLPDRRHRPGQGQDLPGAAQCDLRRRLVGDAGGRDRQQGLEADRGAGPRGGGAQAGRMKTPERRG